MSNIEFPIRATIEEWKVLLFKVLIHLTFLYFVISCSGPKITADFFNNTIGGSDSENNNLTEFIIQIEQHTSQYDPTNNSEIVFSISFNREIQRNSFTTSDIQNKGTASGVMWELVDLGTEKNFTLKASGMSEGTVIPYVAIGEVIEKDGTETNVESVSIDNSVTYDTTVVEVEVDKISADPSTSLPIDFSISFSEPINLSSFELGDLVLAGTSSVSVAQIINTGDNQNFIYRVLSTTGTGSIELSMNGMTVNDLAGNPNTASSFIDKEIVYSGGGLTAEIIHARNENVGSCSFTLQQSTTSSLPVNFKLSFSEPIDATTLTVSDILQTGTASINTWTITSCGDDRNFLVAATASSSIGTIIPNIAAGTVNMQSDGSSLIDLDDSSSSVKYLGANVIIWSGLGGDDNWSTGANWVGGTAPGSSDIAIFDDSCTDCNSIVDISTSIAGLYLFTDFVGVLSFTDNQDLQVGSENVYISGGTVNGASNEFIIESDFIYSAGTVNWNGTLFVCSYLCQITSNGLSYENVELRVGGNRNVNFIDVFDVNGSLSLNGTSANKTIIGDTILLAGDLTIADWTGGSAKITLDGTSVQNITGTTVDGYIGEFEIASSSVVNISNELIVDGDFTYTSGTVNWLSGSSLNIQGFDDRTLTSNGLQYQNVEFTIGSNHNLTIVDEMNIDSELHLNGASGSMTFSGADIRLGGDLVSTNWSGGATKIVFDGTGVQNITGTSAGSLGGIEIASSGSINFNGEILLQGDFTYSTGTVSWDTASELVFTRNASITSNGLVYENVEFAAGGMSSISLNDDMDIDGALHFNASPGGVSINGSDIVLAGDLNVDALSSGSTSLSFNGNSDQYIRYNGGVLPRGNFSVNKVSGSIIQVGNLSLNGAGQDLLINDGDWRTSSYDLQINDQLLIGDGIGSSNSAILNSGCGTLTSGSQTVNPADGLLQNSGSNPNITIDDVSEVEGNDLVFTISLSEPVCGSATNISYSTTNVSTNGYDLTVISGTLTIPAGSVSNTLTLPTFDDAIVEGVETVRIELGTTDNGVITDQYGLGFITDNESTPFVWTGLGVDDNWSNTDNWANNTVPNFGDVVLFDDSCTNCDSIIDGTHSVEGIILSSSYTGSLSIPSGQKLEVDDSDTGFIHSGGDFDIDGELDLIRSAYIQDGGTSDFTNSTVFIKGTGGDISRLKTTTPLYNLVFTRTGSSTNSRTNVIDEVTIENDLTFSTPQASLNSGILVALGDVYANGVDSSSGGLLRIAGSTDQVLSGVSGGGLPSLEIASTGGTVSIVGDLRISPYSKLIRSFLYTSGNTDFSSSHIIFTGGGGDIYPGNVNFNDVTVDKTGSSVNTRTDLYGTMRINGDLTFSGSRGRIEKGVIELAGNFTSSNDRRSSELHFVGTGDQLITSLGYLSESNVTVNKPSGSVIQANSISLSAGGQDLSLVSGTWDMNGFDFDIADVLTLESGTLLDSNCGNLSYSSLVNNGGTLNVLGATPVSVFDASAIEGNSLFFNFAMTRSCPQDLVFNYELISNSATQNVDYNDFSGTVKVNAGTSKGTVVIPTIDDSLVEQNESALLSLKKTLSNNYSPSAQALIIDNDSGSETPMKVAIGDKHLCILMSSGDVKCLGDKSYGILGNADNGDIGLRASDMGSNLGSVNLGTGSTAIQLFGVDYTCALLDNNQVKCFGVPDSNLSFTNVERGKFANTMGDNLEALNLGAGFSITKARGGDDFACFLTSDNRLKCWGRDSDGRLLNAESTSYGYNRKTRGNFIPFLNFGTSRTVNDFDLGFYHGCAILDNSKIKCWGNGSFGALGSADTEDLGDDLSEIGDGLPIVDLGLNYIAKKIALGQNHSCAIVDTDTHGTNVLKCWGLGQHGRLGYGNADDLGDESGEMGDALLPIYLGAGRHAIDISLGMTHTCALLDNASVKCWGNGNSGKLGTENDSDIGNGALEMNSLGAINLGTSRTAKKIEAYDNHTCVILDNDELKCFGNNEYGQLGQGTTDSSIGDQSGDMGDSLDYVDLGPSRTAKSLHRGTSSDHTCVILDNDETKCFGRAENGRLGLENLGVGDSLSDLGANLKSVDLGSGARVKDISANNQSTCALLTNGGVKCWGRNTYGVLGYGISSSGFIGHRASTMGDNLAYLDFGSSRKVLSLKSYEYVHCALLDDFGLSCWGNNGNGHFLSENTVNQDTPYELDLNGLKVSNYDVGNDHMCAIFTDGSSRCWGDNAEAQLVRGNTTDFGKLSGETIANLAPIDHGSKTPVKVDVGYEHTCFVYSDKSVKCWGDRNSGIGQEATQVIGDDSSELGDNLPAINFGTGLSALKITAGGDSLRGHTCAILDNNKLKCFDDRCAEVGYEYGVSCTSGTVKMGDSLPYVNFGANDLIRDIYSYTNANCVITANNEVKCWGKNLTGRFGFYDESGYTGDNPSELGSSLVDIDLGVSSNPIGSFHITGVTGGTDSTLDNYLAHNEATINFSSASSAISYNITIFENDQTTIACSEQNTVATSFSFTGCTLSDGETYYAQVIALDGATNERVARNSLYSFSVNTSAPTAFSILGVIGDADQTLDSSLSDGLIPTIKWEPSEGVSEYELSVYQDAGRSSIQCSAKILDASLNEYNFSDCSTPFVQSDNGSTFYIDLIAIDESGNSTSASNSLFAYTLNDTDAPVVFSILGVNGGSDTNIDNELSNGSWATVNWNDTVGENSYDITIYEDSGEVSVACATVNVPRNTVSYTFENCELSNGSTYYLKVEARDTFSTVEASNSLYSFDVNTTSAGSFSILGVEGISTDTTADNLLAFGNLARVSWTSSSGATSYDVAIYDSDNKAPICHQKNTTSTTFDFDDCYLRGGNSYYLRVSSNNGVSVEASNSPYLFSVSSYPTISLSDSTITEGSNLSFTVTASSTWVNDMTFKYKITSLSAVAGVDYTRVNSSVTLSSGSTSATILIPTIDDNLAELDKTLIISLHDPENATLTSESIALGTIGSEDAGTDINDTRSGHYQTCARSSDGELKCWGGRHAGGIADSGNVGDELSEMGDNLSYINLPPGRSAIDIATGLTVSCVVLDDGTLTCFGDNLNDSLGAAASYGDSPGDMGSNMIIFDFSPLLVTKVVGKADSFCILLSDGAVQCWGKNSRGQLGAGSTTSSLKIAGTINVDLGSGVTAKDIAIGAEAACAILDNDLLKCWGAGANWLQADGTSLNIGTSSADLGDNLEAIDFGPEDRVKKVALARKHYCAILFNDTMKCWGDGVDGALGNGSQDDIGDSPGELASTPAINFGVGRTVKDVSTTESHTCVILDNDQVKCFGGYSSNNNGSLGYFEYFNIGDDSLEVGDEVPYINLGVSRSASQILAGDKFTCVVLDNGDYKCFGDNNYGQIGIGPKRLIPEAGDYNGDDYTAVNLSSTESIKKIAKSARDHQCVIMSNDQVKCWGRRNKTGNNMAKFDGWLGDEDSFVGDDASEMGATLPLVDLGVSRTAKTFDMSSWGVCIGLDNEEHICYGRNYYGMIGGLGYAETNGDFSTEKGDNLVRNIMPDGKNVIKQEIQNSMACFLLDDYTLTCRGNNSKYAFEGKGEINEFNSLRINEKINFGSERSVINFTIVNAGTVCAILDDFSVKCFGEENRGSLGQEISGDIGDTPNSLGDYLKSINLGTNRKALELSARNRTVCSILDSEEVVCWGDGSNGIRGSGNSDDVGLNPGDMGDNLTRLPFSGTSPKVKSLCKADGRGFNTMCAIIEDSGLELRCWGGGNSGMLGIGGSSSQGDQPGEIAALGAIDLGTGRTPVQVSCGNNHNCALLDNGDLKCFGNNEMGQLGIGDNDHRGDDPFEMGDALPAVDVGF